MLATFGLTVWLLAVVFGTTSLARYQSQPGRDASPPSRIDFQSSDIRFDPAVPTLLLFAHPKCPCTRASLTQLSELTAKFGARMSVYVLFFQPSDEPSDWSQTALWRQASEIPHVKVLVDTDAAAANQFGAHTSGQVLLYSSGGNLVFKGGITAGRGHLGDNPGIRAITRYLENGDNSNPQSANVFGCIIAADQEDNNVQ